MNVINSPRNTHHEGSTRPPHDDDTCSTIYFTNHSWNNFTNYIFKSGPNSCLGQFHFGRVDLYYNKFATPPPSPE